MNISPFNPGPNQTLDILMRISMVSALRQTDAAVSVSEGHPWTGRDLLWILLRPISRLFLFNFKQLRSFTSPHRSAQVWKVVNLNLMLKLFQKQMCPLREATLELIKNKLWFK